MKRRALVVLTASFMAGCAQKQQEIHPETKTLTTAVYASGSLLPEQEYKVMPQVDGYLHQALVREGDSVRKGQLLFTIASDVRAAQEQSARQLLARTEPASSDNAPVLRELEAQISLARVKLRQDSLDYRRYERLLQENITSQSNYERYRLQYQASQRDFQNLNERLKQQKLQGAIQLQQAQNGLTVATAQTGAGTIRSFAAGVVYDIYKKEGDLVSPAQPLALIGSEALIARLSVDEDDLDKVHEGQKVLLSMDAFPGKVFRAHVSRIYPLLNRVEQSFRADAVLDEPLPVRMYGLNVEANIVIAEDKKVLAIPKAALLKGDSVLIKEEGQTRRVRIVKGIEDEAYVEVLSGLTSNSTVIIRP